MKRRRREEEGDVLSKVAPAKIAAKRPAIEQDIIDSTDPAEKMKSVKWLRECSNAEGPAEGAT